jgi:hypothetical protein
MDTTAAIISKAKLPVSYTDAKTALARCVKVDECKDWVNRSRALASYARQAKDETLFKMAMRIQLRAVERMGVLLGQIQTEKGKRTDKPHMGTHTRSTDRQQAADEAGLSKHQVDQALQVAAVPKEERDALIESDTPPTVTALAEKGTKKKPKSRKMEGMGPGPFDHDWNNWVFSIENLHKVPACGFEPLLDHVFTGHEAFPFERLISEAHSAIDNLELWIKLLEERHAQTGHATE